MGHTMTDIEELEFIKPIIERSPAIIFRWTVTEGWPVEFVSENISRLGYTREDMLTGKVSWPGITHPDDVPRLEKENEGYLANDVDSWSQTYRVRTANGTYVWMRDWNLLIRDDQGVPKKIQGIAIDVTAQKIAEAQLEDRTKKLAQLAEELTLAEYRERRRMADYLHDHLQQLLVGARMQTHALMSSNGQSTGEDLRKLDDILAEAIDAARNVTRDIAFPVGPDWNLADGFRSLVRDIKDRHRLDVDFRIPVDTILTNAPEAVTVLLYTAARELLLNIVKHAGTLRAHLELTQKHEAIVLEVCDAGCGVASSGASGKEPHGFGLLSIRERTELLGGTFELHSPPNRGTRVVLTIPVPAVSGAHRAARSPQTAIPSDRVSKGERLTPDNPDAIRLLFVDDHRIFRESLVNLLGTHPGICVVGQASNGQEAVECAERLQPDVVIMDVGLPVMDGIEATRLIKRRWPTIKVIGLSMFDEEERGAKMRKAGADDYLHKSGPPERLIEAVGRCMASE
jgi:PAS domain S-box-containing protein